jgi:arylsulfatase A-like enzyme
LKLTGLGAVSALTPGFRLGKPDPGTPSKTPRPNIIIILSDDLGYAGLGCQGGRGISTPNIDSLAQDGTRCTNAYASAPVCAPTRAGLMTGRYQNRFDYETHTGSTGRQVKEDIGVPTAEIFFPEILQKGGYRTAIIGKWHLGINEKYRPHSRGFDEFFGFLAGDHDYYDWGPRSANPIYRNTKIQEQPPRGREYLSEVFSEEAVSFIERNKARPFLLYLAYNAVHTPLEVPDKYTRHLPRTMKRKQRKVVGMTEAMDAGVGKVLGALRDNHLQENTLVVFFSDNGGNPRIGEGINAPLSGGKGQLKEGGIRVPFILRWPARVPAGKIYSQPIISLDLFATALGAAGQQPPGDREIDGVNLLPYLAGARPGPPHEFLFFRYLKSYAARKGPYKLAIDKGLGRLALYDLEADIAEKRDLSDKMPETAQNLKRALENWESRMARPQAKGTKLNLKGP